MHVLKLYTELHNLSQSQKCKPLNYYLLPNTYTTLDNSTSGNWWWADVIALITLFAISHHYD
jgi:hypothetical protein